MKPIFKTLLISLIVLPFVISCQHALNQELIQEGVSLQLSTWRKQHIDSLSYHLTFHLTENPSDSIAATEKMVFRWRGGARTRHAPFVIDFKEDTTHLQSVIINGKKAPFNFRNEHIIFPSRILKKGVNEITLHFLAGEMSLNRRPDFLYTLLVPDRARTLFPCFDQPNLKACYSLTLIVPNGWEAVSNSPKLLTVHHMDSLSTTYSFMPTEPLSTYLFAFVAGKFQKASLSRSTVYGNRNVTLYHRETDPNKVAQCNTILEEVFQSLDYLEDYTSIAYPFAKYDCIAIPGFQYGGMEHTGATLYNDRSLFLEPDADVQKQMSRFSLIAHETAHMWFGDYVTMDWFNDVWTKEVFANYFAARMTSQKFPDVNNAFSFMDYAAAAYSVDRTLGANAIKQPLDNLKDAGLIYGNIIYNKAPIVMQMLANRTGEEAFREGIRQYLRTYAYGNATWEDLIAILDPLSDEDLTQWSSNWVNVAGMPRYQAPYTDEGPWQQPVHLTYLPTGASDSLPIPNLDGSSYGYFALQPQASALLLQQLPSLTDLQQYAALGLLYENYLNANLSAQTYLNFCMDYLEQLARKDDANSILLFAKAMGHMGSAALRFPALASPQWEERLYLMACTAATPSMRRSSLSALTAFSTTSATIRLRLLDIFQHPESFTAIALSESDLTSLCGQLCLRMGEEAIALQATQRSRISNPDRLEQFDFIMRGTDPSLEKRRAFFQSLLQEKNRAIEPWVKTALSYLNHFTWGTQPLEYITPALEIIEEIQRTGDIFFPSGWLSSLLSSHNSPEALQMVDQFLENHTDLNPLLRAKILQESDHLRRKMIP